MIYAYTIRYCYCAFTIIGETIQVFWICIYGGALPYNVHIVMQGLKLDEIENS